MPAAVLHAMRLRPLRPFPRVEPIGRLLALALVALAPALGAAQLNLGFEEPPSGAQPQPPPAWRAGDGLVAALDPAAARSGALGLRVEGRGERGRARFTQTIDARSVGGDRVRVSVHVKSADAATAPAASLRVRVDGRDGLLYIARARPEGAADAEGWRRIVVDAPLAAGAERISIGGELAGTGTAWFDDFGFEALRARTLPPPSAAARRYVERALAIVDEHAVTRAALDWPAYRRGVLEQARGAVTAADAYLAVRFALAALGDGHSFFMSPRQMSNLAEGPVGNARTAQAPTAPTAARLGGDIGYLRLPGIAGGEHGHRVAFAETVQALIAGLDAPPACGWVLDLRGNEGGNLWPMLAGAGPLLGDGDVAYSLRPDGERRRIWYAQGKAGLGEFVQLRVRGRAYRPRRPDAPVAVLVDSDTASAAEIVAAAFAGRAGTRSFGAATGGATSATRTFPLSDGAALVLAVASVADRDGRVLRGPIEPDERVAEASPGEPLSEQAAVRAARRWLLASAVPAGCRRASAALAE